MRFPRARQERLTLMTRAQIDILDLLDAKRFTAAERIMILAYVQTVTVKDIVHDEHRELPDE